jgi:hypothetical protein
VRSFPPPVAQRQPYTSALPTQLPPNSHTRGSSTAEVRRINRAQADAEQAGDAELAVRCYRAALECPFMARVEGLGEAARAEVRPPLARAAWHATHMRAR